MNTRGAAGNDPAAAGAWSFPVIHELNSARLRHRQDADSGLATRRSRRAHVTAVTSWLDRTQGRLTGFSAFADVKSDRSLIKLISFASSNLIFRVAATSDDLSELPEDGRKSENG